MCSDLSENFIKIPWQLFLVILRTDRCGQTRKCKNITPLAGKLVVATFGIVYKCITIYLAAPSCGCEIMVKMVLNEWFACIGYALWLPVREKCWRQRSLFIAAGTQCHSGSKLNLLQVFTEIFASIFPHYLLRKSVITTSAKVDVVMFHYVCLFVCLSVYLSVHKVTQKDIDEFWQFSGRCAVWQATGE